MSSNATIRLRPESHRVLKEIAQLTGESLQSALDRAIEDLRRKTYLEGLNADYAALRKDPKAWQEFQKELEDFDSTNNDGLEDA
ncbi:MAG TPA: hypothetical protein VIM11_23460 [Tepidisphaeraceae bacterium]|jgi:hypothetical protein